MSPCVVPAMLDCGRQRLDVSGANYAWANPDLPTGSPDATFTLAASSDDAEQRLANNAILGGAEIWLRNASGDNRLGGFRFTGTALPDSKYIVKAEQRWTRGTSIYDAGFGVYIYGHKVTNSPTFVATLGDSADIWSRYNSEKTTARAAYIPDNPTSGVEYASPDISAVLQEIYDLGERSTFTTIWDPSAGSNFDNMRVYGVDASSGAYASELDIWYADAPLGSEYRLETPLVDLTFSGNAPSNFHVFEDGTELTEGTVGSLAAGEWGVSGGYLYVRLSDEAAPSDKAGDFIQLSFDVSTTGDGSSWEECRILWQVEGDGSALADWPDKYRKVIDPRNGLDSKEIDLAGQTSTNNYNRPRGFNFGPVLTQGTFRFKATVTNQSGESSTVTSSDVVIAANSRAVKTVQATGGDHTTLADALSTWGAEDDIEIIIEDGHTENLASSLADVSGKRFRIRQAGSGTRPRFTVTDSSVGYFIRASGEQAVIEDLEILDTTGDYVSTPGTYTVRSFITQANCIAHVNCHVLGDETYALTYSFSGQVSCEGWTIQACTTEACESHHWSSEAGFKPNNSICVIGCSFGRSLTESVIRTTGEPEYFNVLWCDLDNTGAGNSGKSSLRFHEGDYLHAYGCRLTQDHWLGSANPASERGPCIIRSECHYSSNLMPLVTTFLNHALVANCIATQQADLGNDATQNGNGVNYFKQLHCTQKLPSGYSSAPVRGANNDNQWHANNRYAANIVALDGTFNASYILDIGDDAATFENNVFNSTAASLIKFARVWVNGSINRSWDTVAQFNTESWASGNSQKDITLDADFIPESPDTVTTEPGVYDDYFGRARGATSWAGAVGSEASALLTAADVRRGMLDGNGNLKPGLVNSSYTGGDGTAETLKPSLLDGDGNLKPGWLNSDGSRKSSNRAQT